ncbi:hypothetical protein HDA40_002798 [Hamadaea flava]|uniref:Uncharacterized protein n=1 Tax=Hamadaea flava TaxID=1742688 RepID=A0ABV8LHP0_9ACTN|nr:hypothetical protein [Hamadaea flava]MCP2324291.1 hypothetical protein [Hamadaea flava]
MNPRDLVYRLLTVAAAVAATAPVWPVLQPGDPIADELLEPVEVAVLVPMVLIFPIAWALLARRRAYAWRVGLALAVWVLAWSVWTVSAGSYASPPTIDDGLRWHLVGAGLLVAGAVAYEAKRLAHLGARLLPGALVWLLGVTVTLAVPVVGAETVPPSDTVLPLPAGMTVVHEETGCTNACTRRITVEGTGTQAELTRRLGLHLEQTKGWRATWFDFAPPQFQCRHVGWLNPYDTCVELRTTGSASTVEIWLATSNGRDNIVY